MGIAVMCRLRRFPALPFLCVGEIRGDVLQDESLSFQERQRNCTQQIQPQAGDAGASFTDNSALIIFKTLLDCQVSKAHCRCLFTLSRSLCFTTGTILSACINSKTKPSCIGNVYKFLLLRFLQSSCECEYV